MKMIKCENNHVFDSDKFISCPHCANQQAGVSIENILGHNQSHVPTEIPTEKNLQANRQLTLSKTVGWLVCIHGSMIGESFVLREGDNHIGRAANMDIALIYEPSVSRENHAIISYQSAEHTFLLFSSNSQGKVLCNNKSIKRQKRLKSRDIITLGNCLLMFVPFCNATFSWSSLEEDNP